MRNPSRLLVIAILLLPLYAAAEDPVQEVRDCLARNVPKKSSVQTVHFTSFDRIGGQREFRAKMLGMKLPDGFRRAKLCITAPPDMRSSEMLSVENSAGAPDSFLYTPELRKAKRITGEGVGGSVFGTDFTYEDLQRWQQLNRPESHERLADATVDGRPVYVLSTKPTDASQSSYSKVLTYIDKKTCVVIKSESFEGEDRLRKQLTAKVDDMLEDHGIHAPNEVEMKDVRDETHTTVVIEDLDVDGDVDERTFQESSLGRHCR